MKRKHFYSTIVVEDEAKQLDRSRREDTPCLSFVEGRNEEEGNLEKLFKLFCQTTMNMAGNYSIIAQ